MIVVHHLNNSRSQRILWLLEELELPYQIKRYQRDPTTLLAPEGLRTVHFLGKSPVITDGNVVVAESGVIIEYLLDVYGGGRLRPPPGPERLNFSYWLHYAEGSAMPPLLLSVVTGAITGPQVPWFARPFAKRITTRLREKLIEPQIRLHLDFMEAHLAQSNWFSGRDFTAADIQMSFPVHVASNRGMLDRRYINLSSWLTAIHARPAYQRALSVGGPYELVH